MLKSAFLVMMLSALGYAESASSADVLDRYLRAKQAAQSELLEESMNVEIDASLPRLKKQASMYGLRLITRAGRVAYTMLRFSGDNVVKTQVIARFLNAEINQPSGGEDLTISAANYRFQYKGIADYAGRAACVFRVAPKRKRVGLFKGELWLDQATALPLREWGDLAKSPSPFVRRIRFVRDYVLTGGRTEVRRLILTARALFVGEVDMTMWFGNEVSSAQQPTEE